MTTTKTDEAKAALEKGDFDKAMGLVEAALSEQPDDPSARELYAITHLARAIRLSDKAREARRTDLLRREIDYDQEFHDVPEVARTFDEAIAAIEDVLRVDPAHWKARML
ncbi:MAG: tetratricopeptide repeat protein, partial [Methanobacteriota archaeon]